MHLSPIELPGRLATALTEFQQASNSEAILHTLFAAAHHVAGCDAVGLRVPGDAFELFAACGQSAGLSPAESFIGRLPAGSCDGIASFDAASPRRELVGSRRNLPVLALASVQLPAVSGSAVVDFIWSSPQNREQCVFDALRCLATAAGLALQLRWRDESAQLERQVYQHRIRHVLAFVRSIIRRTMQSAESPEDFAARLEARIGTLTRTQTTLNLAGAAGVEIEDLIRTELRANLVRDDQFDIVGPSVRLCAKAAETMALAFHELAVNSLKFGAFAERRGRAKIHWQTSSTSDGPRLRLRWIESGVRVASLAPRRRGFGQELIERTLPYELDALTQFELTPGGLRCMVDMPLDVRATVSPTFDSDVTFGSP